MDKKKLDQAAVIACMGGDKQSKVSLVITIILFATIIMIPIGILVLIARKHQQKTIHMLKDRQYRLQPDSVFRKYMERSVDSYDIPCVIFNNYGKMELNAFPSSVYNQLEPGNKLYLLQNAAGKVLYIFNCRDWELDETAFEREGKYYYPVP